MPHFHCWLIFILCIACVSRFFFFASNCMLGTFQNVLGNFLYAWHQAMLLLYSTIGFIFLDWHRLTCGFASLILM